MKVELSNFVQKILDEDEKYFQLYDINCKTNFYIGNIGLNAGFYLQTWTLTALAAGNYDVTSYTASISAVATLTVSSPVYTNVSTIVITSSVTILKCIY